MGLFDWAKGQFIEIIEWQDSTRDTVLWRFPVYRNEIKYGAQLTVREGQVAVMLNEGTIADVFVPGRHELVTKNMPILSSLQGWKYGFESPFKAEVMFVSTRRFVDLKWGTLNPVMLRDADFGALRLRAFGTYALVVQDAKALVQEHASTAQQLLISDMQDHLRNKIVARFTDSLAESKVAALDLASRYDELSELLGDKLNVELKAQGLGVADFHIENISLPPEVEQALDAKSKMSVIGDLNAYTKFQAAESLPKAAENQGIAGAGVGIGVGAGLGAVLGQGLAQSMQPMLPAASGIPVGAVPAAASGASAAPAASAPIESTGAAKFCHQCGGALVPPGAKFCSSCGARLG